MYKNIIAMPTVGLMLSLLLFLCACSGGAGSNASSSGAAGGAGQAATQSAAGSDSKNGVKPGAPVTIKHLKGELTLERRPEKIAVLDTQFVDQLLALNEQPAGGQESRLPNVSLTEMQVTQPSAGRRYEWRDAVIKSLFHSNMAPIFRSISKAAAVPMPVLWENAAVRLYSLYEKRLGVGASEQDKVREDFEYLVHEAPASLFGETKNPFAAFYGNTLTAASSSLPVRQRKTCCFYYLIDSDGAYCSNCPKL